MKHLKTFEMKDFYSGEGPSSGKPNLTKADVLAMIKEILNNSPEFNEEFFVSTVSSMKGNYLEIVDKEDRSTGIYISEIDPGTYSRPREPYDGI